MANTVIQISMTEIQKIKAYYEAYVTDKIPQGGLFVIKAPTFTITAYRSGKVMFQGQGGEQEAEKWGGKQSLPPTKTSNRTTNKSNVPPKISSMSVIGSDEVGTGDFFGPITVVAAYVKKEQLQLVKELGVKDSKELNDTKICEIAKDLIKTIPYSLLVLHNEKYNELQQSRMSQGKMKALLHNKAILHVLNKIAPEQPEAILIDQFAEKDVYFKHIQGQKTIQRDNVYFSTKAERIHLSVAAASIIARYAFLKEMEKLSKEAGFTIPKGAGAQVDVAAAKLIKSKGKEILPHFVKLHFANTEKAFKKLK